MAADDRGLDAAAIIDLLGLEPHPEGGHYREIFRDRPADGGRGAATAIYYLLGDGEVSAWHRVDALEVWNHYAGAALELTLSDDRVVTRSLRLGTDLAAGERPQAVVPAGVWQRAAPLGPWTLAGCTVAPAFEFAGFELAP